MTPRPSDRLRTATRTHHDALEALAFFTDLAAGRIARDAYVSFLRANRVFFRAIEEAAARSPDPILYALLHTDERATPLLDLDLAALDRAPDGPLRDAELRAIAAAHDLGLATESRPARLAGYLYVLMGSQLGGLSLRDTLGRTLDLPGPGGLRFMSRGGSHAAARWRAFRERLDRALTDEVAIDEASRAANDLFHAFARSFEESHDARHAHDLAHGRQLNPDAGAHAITDDPRELDAALRAGERSWSEQPYYGQRYGARGRGFTRSDSAWLVTLASAPPSVREGQIDWLARVLAARGMPRLLLERHLLALHDELVKSSPERAARYGPLTAAARKLADERRAHVSDAGLTELARRFDERVGAELAAALPHVGELIAAAVADERAGVAQAVASLTAWLSDRGRFSSRWIDAVHATIAEARANAE